MIVLFAFVLAYSYFGFAEDTCTRKWKEKFTFLLHFARLIVLWLRRRYFRSTKQIKTGFICFCSRLFVSLQTNPVLRSAAGAFGHERKVRAAQGAPLPKVEAIGDSRCRQKKITAPDSGVRVRRWCKRPPAVGWSTGCASWGLQVHVNRWLRVARPSSALRWLMQRRVEC